MGEIIYKITNNLNGKIYIGQTIHTAKVRFWSHSRSNSVLGKDIQKYGKNNFSIEVIEKCESPAQLNEREKFWIEKLSCRVPNGYNVSKGGKGGRGEAYTRNLILLQEIQKRYGHYKIPDDKDVPDILSEIFGLES